MHRTGGTGRRLGWLEKTGKLNIYSPLSMKRYLINRFLPLLVMLYNPMADYGQGKDSYTKQLLPVKKPAGKVSLLKLQLNHEAFYLKEINEAGRLERFFTNSRLRPAGQSTTEKNNKFYSPEADKKYEIQFSQFTTAVQNNSAVYLFGVTTEGRIFFTVMKEEDRFSYWKELNTRGLAFRQIIAVENTGGTLQLFGLAADGAVYHNKQAQPRDSTSKNWSGWVTLFGHNLKQILCEKSPSGSLLVLALSNDGSVYYIRQAEPLASAWKNWETLGGTLLQKIDLEKNADGRLVVFAIGSDKSIYTVEQSSPEGGWNRWTALPGKNVSDITSEIAADGNITLFALHPDGSIQASRQQDPGGALWGKWVDLCPPKTQAESADSALASSVDADGKISVYQIYNWELFYAAPMMPAGTSGGCTLLKIQ